MPRHPNRKAEGSLRQTAATRVRSTIQKVSSGSVSEEPPRQQRGKAAAASICPRRRRAQPGEVARDLVQRMTSAAEAPRTVVPLRVRGRVEATSRSSSRDSVRSVSVEVRSSSPEDNIDAFTKPRRPRILEPLPASCGTHQYEEDSSLHFNSCYLHLCRWEEEHMQQPSHLDDVPIVEGGGQVLRRQLLNGMVRAHQRFELRHNTLYLAVALLDQCLVMKQLRVRPFLLAATALLVATKFEEEQIPDPELLAEVVGDAAPHLEELASAELELLNAIEFRMHRPTPAHHLHWFVETLLEGSKKAGAQEEKFKRMSFYICELGLLSASSARWAPSLHAAAAPLLAWALLKWPSAASKDFERFAAKIPRRLDQLRVILRHMCKLIGDKSVLGHAIYIKYSTQDSGQISSEVWRSVRTSKV